VTYVVPEELKRMLEVEAGKERFGDGTVLTSLARILERHEEMVRDQVRRELAARDEMPCEIPTPQLRQILAASETEQLAELARPRSTLDVLRVAEDLLGDGDDDAPGPETLMRLVETGALTINQARWIYIAAHVLAALRLGTAPSALLRGDLCPRCHDRGVIPDWSHWNAEHGELRPKPCPACTEEKESDA
jgi:hypothetical protein